MSTFAAQVHAAVVPFVTDPPPNGQDVKPGWVALVLVLGLCVITALLWLNMRKQLRKIDFDEDDTKHDRDRSDEPAPDGGADVGPADVAADRGGDEAVRPTDQAGSRGRES
jgi:hypothetical protein